MFVIRVLFVSALPLIVMMAYIISSAAAMPTKKSVSTGLFGYACQEGSFLFKLEYGDLFGIEVEVDEELRGVICRPCQICPDGAVILSPCTPTTDTVCGECAEGLIFDNGTKSCQPQAVIDGTQDLTDARKASTPQSECQNGLGDATFQVTSTDVDALFIASATLFAVVLVVSIVLVFIAVVVKLKRKTCTIQKGRNLPSKIPAMIGNSEKDTKKANIDKSGHVNAAYKNDESQLTLLSTKEGDGSKRVTDKQGMI